MTRPNRTPKKLYWVDILPGGNPLPYRQRGGGVFSTLAMAKGRCEKLAHLGVLTRIFVSAKIEWSPTPTDVEGDA